MAGGTKFFLEKQVEDKYKQFSAKSRSNTPEMANFAGSDSLDEIGPLGTNKGLSRAERRLKQKLNKDNKKP